MYLVFKVDKSNKISEFVLHKLIFVTNLILLNMKDENSFYN